jgi:hypothetical protein
LQEALDLAAAGGVRVQGDSVTLSAEGALEEASQSTIRRGSGIQRIRPLSVSQAG